ncbi:hypothetical protein VP01_6388g1 [Puccinia sorghi]|uniref:Uncharacterized protein n=1 Tax=Puccinia sorghi TaxID=27349 RepID=A0A0L6UI19_9BASI|nr:hypothetical protein VP01_6388g1 [Puccinia sorghi]
MSFDSLINFNTKHKYISYIHPPSLVKGLQLIQGFCQEVLLGKNFIAGFPTLHDLSHMGTLSSGLFPWHSHASAAS